ncbi:hypothetical protein ACGF0D_25700 [Kitasatospora sp. NPDC048298]
MSIPAEPFGLALFLSLAGEALCLLGLIAALAYLLWGWIDHE